MKVLRLIDCQIANAVAFASSTKLTVCGVMALTQEADTIETMVNLAVGLPVLVSSIVMQACIILSVLIRRSNVFVDIGIVCECGREAQSEVSLRVRLPRDSQGE